MRSAAAYEKEDSRIRYLRHPVNIGLAQNHNFVVQEARGELFKWAASDDLYARNLIERCVEALDEYPDMVLAHSWTAKVDSSGNVTKAYEYPIVDILAARPRSLPQHPIRWRWRRRLWRHADRCASPDGDEGKLSSRRPHHHSRTRPAGPILSSSRLAVLPSCTSRAEWPSENAQAVRRTWIRGAPTGCGTRLSAFTASTY